MLLEKLGSTFTSAYAYGNGLIRKDTEYPMFDGLGSERTVTNGSQAVTGTATYDGFGQTVATTGSSTDPYMFAAKSGYRNDGDCGLSLVGARYYDSQVGRFQTRDTELTQHPYAYCNADPVNCLDPSGHLLFLVVLLVVAILVDTALPADPPTHDYRQDRMPALTPIVVEGALLGASLKGISDGLGRRYAPDVPGDRTLPPGGSGPSPYEPVPDPTRTRYPFPPSGGW